MAVAAVAVDVGGPSAIASDGDRPVAHAVKKKRCKAKESRKKRCRKRRPAQQQADSEPLPPPALAFEQDLQVQVDPAIYPAFDPDVSDYVTRCDGVDPVSVSVSATGLVVSVDGSPPRKGAFTVPVPLEEGQGFSISVQGEPYSRDFHVRCLPSDFPEWGFDRLGQPNNEFYLVDPNFNLVGPPTESPGNAIVFDDWGVPIWWFKSDARPVDSKVLSDGTIAFYDSPPPSVYEIRRLDGTLIDTRGVVGGGVTDFHDLQELPNGNHLLLEYRDRADANQTTCTGSPSTTVTDAVIQEIDPSGSLVWEWNSKDHIAPEETGRWCSTIGGPPFDIAHINAVEPAGGSLIISLRHTDAIYKIDRTTGAVVWKLGGTTTPQSLAMLGDPHGDYPLGGQHDPRLQADGSVTIHDNATNLTGDAAHAPRVVRYAIDEGAMTATLVESITDPEVSQSGCCGGTRRSPSGAWVMSWGLNNLVTEFGPGPAHERVFRLTFDNAFSYRVFPVPPGQLTRSALRAGMDAQYPRP